jgi:hypothetical protein
MKLSFLAISLAACGFTAVSGFTQLQQSKSMIVRSTALEASSSHHGDSRRNFFSKTLATAVTSAAAATGGIGVLAPLPAHAVKGADKVNAQLKA